MSVCFDTIRRGECSIAAIMWCVIKRGVDCPNVEVKKSAAKIDLQLSEQHTHAFENSDHLNSTETNKSKKEFKPRQRLCFQTQWAACAGGI